MDKTTIEKTIKIKAPIKKVWSVFTDPEVAKQMGGYYETNWKIGSSFGFKKSDGTKITNGKLLELEQERLLKHSLFAPGSRTVMAIIAYEFEEKEGYTLLRGREELTQPLAHRAYEAASDGWAIALKAVQAIAESL